MDRRSFLLGCGGCSVLPPRFTRPELESEEGGLWAYMDTTVARDGPALGGLAYGAVVGGRLYLMSYTAPKGYLYLKHLVEVQAIAASARIRIPESAACASP